MLSSETSFESAGILLCGIYCTYWRRQMVNPTTVTSFIADEQLLIRRTRCVMRQTWLVSTDSIS